MITDLGYSISAWSKHSYLLYFVGTVNTFSIMTRAVESTV